MSVSGKPSARCFLCRSEDADIRHSLRADELLILWKAAGVQFSEEALAHLSSADQVNLFCCRNCGFQFFDPRLAGNHQFYAELQAQVPGYYAPARPENERNARFAQGRGFDNILDVGCGTGFALDVARERGLATYGIELNASAAGEARSRGHTVFSVPVEQLEPVWHRHFDLISLNQLLEHLPDPVQFVKNCAQFLRPNGVIAIAVPSSDGILRFDPLLPANWPPHHLSWWRKKDFYRLSISCDLAVLKIGGNRLLGTDLETNLLANREHRLTLGKSYYGPEPGMIRLLVFAYKKTGLKHVFRSHGHSIYCFLKRAP